VGLGWPSSALCSTSRNGSLSPSSPICPPTISATTGLRSRGRMPTTARTRLHCGLPQLRGLLGWIVFVTALRHPVPQSTLARTLLDVAVAAMAISVAVEIAQLGLTSTAAWLAESGTGADAIVALDGAATVLFALVVGPSACRSWRAQSRSWLTGACPLGSAGSALPQARSSSRAESSARQVPATAGQSTISPIL
jgi:hypothetical protein